MSEVTSLIKASEQLTTFDYTTISSACNCYSIADTCHKLDIIESYIQDLFVYFKKNDALTEERWHILDRALAITIEFRKILTHQSTSQKYAKRLLPIDEKTKSIDAEDEVYKTIDATSLQALEAFTDKVLDLRQSFRTINGTYESVPLDDTTICHLFNFKESYPTDKQVLLQRSIRQLTMIKELVQQLQYQKTSGSQLITIMLQVILWIDDCLWQTEFNLERDLESQAILHTTDSTH